MNLLNVQENPRLVPLIKAEENHQIESEKCNKSKEGDRKRKTP